MTIDTEQIATLFLQAGQAHHQAFSHVDGDDPDWPLWYAAYLQEKLPPLLGQSLTRSELTYQLIFLDKSYVAKKREIPWNQYYAQLLIEQFAEPATSDSVALVGTDNVPSLTTEQMMEVDRAMVEDFQIDLTQMMENAGRNLAHLARQRFLNNDPQGKNIVVLAGTGGNGGGALAAARRLITYGASVIVITTRTADSFRGVPAHQLTILKQMKIPIYQDIRFPLDTMVVDLIIDGIIGYSLSGAPRHNAAAMIRWANGHNAPVLALDVPSGIDAATGQAYDPTVEAAATMTLALPKTGLMQETLFSKIGELYLADISVPPALYAGPGLEMQVGPIFARSDIVRLR